MSKNSIDTINFIAALLKILVAMLLIFLAGYQVGYYRGKHANPR